MMPGLSSLFSSSTYAYSYDELGRQTSVLDPRGFITAMGYDLLGRQVGIKDPSGNVTRFDYNARGQTTLEQTFGLG